MASKFISKMFEAFVYNQLDISKVFIVWLFVCSFQYWFQNRRAKSRRQEKEVKSVYQTSSSNQSGRPVSRVMPSERPQFRTQFPSYAWKQAERMSYPMVQNQLKHKPRSRPITTDYHNSSFKSNQFRGSSSLQVPMFHPDQFKISSRDHPDQLTQRFHPDQFTQISSTESARLPHSHGLRRYEPY